MLLEPLVLLSLVARIGEGGALWGGVLEHWLLQKSTRAMRELMLLLLLLLLLLLPLPPVWLSVWRGELLALAI